MSNIGRNRTCSIYGDWCAISAKMEWQTKIGKNNTPVSDRSLPRASAHQGYTVTVMPAKMRSCLGNYMYYGVQIRPNIWANCDIRYLWLGRRYEAGICTIVISMNGAFQWCQFCYRLNFDPKSWKTMDYSLWSSAIFDKNVTETKIHFKDIIWKLLLCWPQWHNPQLHISLVVGWILTQNHEKPWIIAFGWVRFLTKMWPTLKIILRTSFESCVYADHNGTTPSFISH